MSSASTWPSVLSTLAAGDDLDAADAAWAMDQILTNQASPAQFGAFVMGLRTKGESPTEVQALVETMLGHARLLDFGPAGSPLALDVVGTGGDQANTVNISTMAALVCAAAKVPVVKHGNRAASSATGTADVLEALGVVIALEPELVVRSLDEAGIGFCFAQVHHPALRHVGPWRRELGVPTVFNILGPLTNPGRAGAALIGCANEALAPVMADVLSRRAVRALVVRGEDGLDEISTAAPTRVWDARGDQVTTTVFDPVDQGIARRSPELLRGGDSARNAELLVAALEGGTPSGADAERVEAIRDAVAVNAAAALVAYEAARQEETGDQVSVADLSTAIAALLPVTQAILHDGSALAALRQWAVVTTELASD